jgi:hypothetical protein
MTKPLRFCGTCTHAHFERTPTGRIKRNLSGRCTKQFDLIAAFSTPNAPPCLVFSNPTACNIWPDYDATHCPLWQPIQPRRP